MSGSFIAFWLREARLVAATNVNVWDVTQPIESLIRSQEPLEPPALADPDVPLDELVPSADPT